MWPFNVDRPCPTSDAAEGDANYTLARLDCLIGWYERQSRVEGVWHKILRIASISVAALVTVLATAGVASLYLAIAGAVVVIAQGVDELFQFQTSYVKDAETKEILKREKALYFATAGPYATDSTSDPGRLLAVRIEDVAGRELASWVKSQSAQSSLSQDSRGGSPAPKRSGASGPAEG
jgi:hypothetical protein